MDNFGQFSQNQSSRCALNSKKSLDKQKQFHLLYFF